MMGPPYKIRYHHCLGVGFCMAVWACVRSLLWWRLGVVVSVVGRINEVDQHWARLVHDG